MCARGPMSEARCKEEMGGQIRIWRGLAGVTRLHRVLLAPSRVMRAMAEVLRSVCSEILFICASVFLSRIICASRFLRVINCWRVPTISVSSEIFLSRSFASLSRVVSSLR